MKYTYKITRAVAGALLLLWVSSASAGDLNESIAGMKWGDPLSDLSRFKQVLSRGDVALYVDTQGTYTIAKVKASDVIFGFYKDRFFSVFLKVGSPEIFAELRRSLTTKLGQPNTTMTMKNEQKIYNWKSGKVKVKLKHYIAKGDMKLAFYYTPLSRQLNEAEMEKISDPRAYRLFPVSPGVRPRGIPIMDF